MPDDLNPQERRALRGKVRDATLEALRSLGGEASRHDIHATALEVGGFTPREIAAAPPESAPADCERLVDNLLRWQLTNLKRDGLVDNPRRGTWRLVGAAAEADPVLLDERLEPDRETQLEAMSYRDYLRTPEWRRIRAAALLRAGNRCALNAEHPGPLHVHHNSYDSRRGAERARDLTVLCEACHNRHHREDGRPGRRPRGAFAEAESAGVASPPGRERTDSVPPPGLATGGAAAATSRRPSLLRRLLRAS